MIHELPDELKKYYEQKFIVFNIKHLENLHPAMKANLSEVMHAMEELFKKEGRNPPEYYVCNQDEDYADNVIREILQGEITKDTGRQHVPECECNSCSCSGPTAHRRCR